MHRLVILLLTAMTCPGHAEDVGPSLYTRSLVAYVQAKQKQVPSRDAIVVIENIVVADPTFAYLLPSKVGNVRLEILGTESLKARFKLSRRPFGAVEVKPMINSGDELIVNCAEFRVSVKKGVVLLGVVGGVKFHWRYDSAEGDYAIAKIEPWRVQL